MPGVSPGDGSGPGCFTHLKGVQISKAQLFWWECIMTFVLVCVVYATAVTKPGHGSLAPLAIGITLYASAAVGELIIHPCNALSLQDQISFSYCHACGRDGLA